MSAFVIVGGGLAGARAAQTLREEGFDGRVVLVGDEPERPYERPPLSKGYLQGTADRASLDAEVPDDVELRTGIAATHLDTAAHTVTLAGGEELRYERLLLATGATPISLSEHALTLRTVADADALAAHLRRGSGRVVVVGAGWIGCEVAASARAAGLDVVLVERGSAPLERVLGPELGSFYADLHRDNGVEVITGAAVERFAPGYVELSGGLIVECDVTVTGVGVRPNVELAENAGLATGDGVLVDAMLRSSDPDVFAAGDVAAAWHPFVGRHLRVEHWANALNQGPAAARSMLDRGAPYERLPYFWSDQFDVGMEYSGHAGPDDELVIRGSLADRKFIAYWLAAGHLRAAMTVNVWGLTEQLQDLIRAGRPVDDLVHI